MIYFNGTDLNEFTKIASEYIGDESFLVPDVIAHDAMNLYKCACENPYIITELANNYDYVDAGMDKIAAKMVLANAYHNQKIAGILSSAGSTVFNRGFDVYGGKARAEEAINRNGGVNTITRTPREV